MQIKNLIVLLFCSFILVACVPKINKVDKIDESKISDELKSLKLTNDKNELSIKYHLYDMDEKDQEIFRQLKISGKREEGRYFQQFYPKRWIKDEFNPDNIKEALDSL